MPKHGRKPKLNVPKRDCIDFLCVSEIIGDMANEITVFGKPLSDFDWEIYSEVVEDGFDFCGQRDLKYDIRLRIRVGADSFRVVRLVDLLRQNRWLEGELRRRCWKTEYLGGVKVRVRSLNF